MTDDNDFQSPEYQYQLYLSQPVEDMVDFGDNDFSDSAWDELRKTIEKIYKDINRTPARTRAARKEFTKALEQLTPAQNDKLFLFMEASALNFMCHLKAQINELIKLPHFRDDDTIIAKVLLQSVCVLWDNLVRNTRVLDKPMRKLYKHAEELGIKYSFVYFNEVLFKELILEDEKISHYLDFSREMAASQSEDKKTSPQVLEFLKLLDSLNFKFPILKHTVALYHFVKDMDIEEAKSVVKLIKEKFPDPGNSLDIDDYLFLDDRQDDSNGEESDGIADEDEEEEEEEDDDDQYIDDATDSLDGSHISEREIDVGDAHVDHPTSIGVQSTSSESERIQFNRVYHSNLSAYNQGHHHAHTHRHHHRHHHHHHHHQLYERPRPSEPIIDTRSVDELVRYIESRSANTYQSSAAKKKKRKRRKKKKKTDSAVASTEPNPPSELNSSDLSAYPQFWTCEGSDPGVDEEVERFIKQLEEDRKLASSPHIKRAAIKDYDVLAKFCREHTKNLFKHLYTIDNKKYN